MQAWVFIQDASQLRSLYPDSWPAIVNNCAVVQLLGEESAHGEGVCRAHRRDQQ